MQDQRLLAYLHYQRFLGLTNIDYSSCLQRYVVHATCCSRNAQLLTLCLIFGALIEPFLATRVDYVGIESSVGKAFYQIVVFASPTTELLLHIWMRLQQHVQQTLLNRLSDLAGRLQVNTTSLSCPRWLYRIWLGISLLYSWNFLIYTIDTWTASSQLRQLPSLICLCMHLVLINYVITCYTALVYVVMSLLQAQADQLRLGVLITLEELTNSLCIHDELLLLCHEEMLQVFGGALIFPFLYFVLDATFICYIATFEDRFSYKEVLMVLCWLTPLFFYMGMPLMINDVVKQVS